MKISLEIDGYLAKIQYDREIEMWRGEFLGPEGGADFYARDFGDLQREGETSLKAFKEMCLEDGIQPQAQLQVFIPSELHRAIESAADAGGMTVDQWVQHELHAGVAERRASYSPSVENPEEDPPEPQV